MTTISIPGIDFDTIDANGTDWGISLFDGWGGAASTVTLTQKPYAAGAWTGSPPQLKSRSVSIGGIISAATPALALAAEDLLNASITLAPFTLTVNQAGGSRWAKAMRQGEVTRDYINDRAFKWGATLAIPDPLKYGQSLTASTKLPSTTGGLTVPFTVPFTIDATTVTGQCSLTNAGNATGPVTARIDGPCSGTTTITHNGTGKRLQFGSSLSLPEGQFMLIDMTAHTVLEQGQADRLGYVTDYGWSGFEPGVNTWSFASSGEDDGAVLTITATEAWQ